MSAAERLYRLLLLWLAGAGLRVTLLALPPVLPLIHRDLALGETAIAILTGMPVLLLAILAVPGSLLVAKLGAERAVIVWLAVIAASGAMRGIGHAKLPLFAMTFLMGTGISGLQPAMPALVQRWFPAAPAFATAIYANGLLVGEMFCAGLTLPLTLGWFGGDWGWGLALWSVPVAATPLLMLRLGSSERGSSTAARRRWWPDWRDRRIWQLGLMQAGNGAVFFGANAFIPDFLQTTGNGDWVALALGALNAGPLLSSALLLLLAHRFAGRRAPLLAAGLLIFPALAAMLTGAPVVFVLGAALLGFAAGLALILLIALPPLIADADSVHRFSAGMFAIGFTLAFLLPLVGGAIWDATSRAEAAFFPIAAGALLIVLGALRMPEPSRPR